MVVFVVVAAAVVNDIVVKADIADVEAVVDVDAVADKAVVAEMADVVADNVVYHILLFYYLYDALDN